MSTYTVPSISNDVIELSMRCEDDYGHLAFLPIWFHNGAYFVEGIPGRRYIIDVKNRSNVKRVEVVVGVDGIDINDGEDASETKSGLVIPARGQWSFEGYRSSMKTVATFRFCNPEGSYAELTGRPKNIGVIGVAAYEEKDSFRYDVDWSPVSFYPETRHSDNRVMSPMKTVKMPRASIPQSLGTQYGEERQSSVRSVHFDRQNLSANALVTVRYETAEVLERMGIPVRRSTVAAPEMRPNPFPATPMDHRKFVSPPPGGDTLYRTV